MDLYPNHQLYVALPPEQPARAAEQQHHQQQQHNAAEEEDEIQTYEEELQLQSYEEDLQYYEDEQQFYAEQQQRYEELQGRGVDELVAYDQVEEEYDDDDDDDEEEEQQQQQEQFESDEYEDEDEEEEEYQHQQTHAGGANGYWTPAAFAVTPLMYGTTETTVTATTAADGRCVYYNYANTNYVHSLNYYDQLTGSLGTLGLFSVVYRRNRQLGQPETNDMRPEQEQHVGMQQPLHQSEEAQVARALQLGQTLLQIHLQTHRYGTPSPLQVELQLETPNLIQSQPRSRLPPRVRTPLRIEAPPPEESAAAVSNAAVSPRPPDARQTEPPQTQSESPSQQQTSESPSQEQTSESPLQEPSEQQSDEQPTEPPQANEQLQPEDPPPAMPNPAPAQNEPAAAAPDPQDDRVTARPVECTIITQPLERGR